MPDDAIVVEDLTFAYGDLLAVDHISFTVAEQEILGFLGPNGAGKTTTVNMLTGQLKPRSGAAHLLGFDVLTQLGEVHRRIGVSFEATNVYEEMSAAENLNLFARLFGVKDFDPNTLLARVGLSGREKERVGNYSKGMKQRLMVARAIVSKPEVVFLDEPTSGLDPASAEAIRAVILEERERGATVFLTTHDMMEADKLADRVAFMNQGKIVALDTPHNLKQQHGTRALRAKVATAAGLEDREISLDEGDTAESVRKLFAEQDVVTIHSEEASLEEVFIKLTGRGLDR